MNENVFDEILRKNDLETALKYGVVYTPCEIVDFMCLSVKECLIKEFKINTARILEPFAGTGNIIKGVKRNNLNGKITAIEIMKEPYQSLCREYSDVEIIHGNAFDVLTEQEEPVEVIITNPPYGNCEKHKRIDDRISETYAKNTKAGNKTALYDGYIRAFRLFSDYLKNGIICMVVNNGFLTARAMDGLRKELETTYDKIFIYDLKGNARTSGEIRKAQGGKVFGTGCRCGICIVLLLRKGGERN